MNEIKMRFNARGEEITKGKTYYTREKVNKSIANGSYYTNLGYKGSVVVYSQEMVIVKIANKDYKCKTCGGEINEGDLYGKSSATFSTDKYCIDCITQIQEEEEIREMKK